MTTACSGATWIVRGARPGFRGMTSTVPTMCFSISARAVVLVARVQRGADAFVVGVPVVERGAEGLRDVRRC